MAKGEAMPPAVTGQVLALGFTCGCGEEHHFPAYVYAHWDISLQFKCPLCGHQYDVLRGVADLVETPMTEMRRG